ncbi:hypothetical protein GCM10028794_15000 [Silanimonas algicola]
MPLSTLKRPLVLAVLATTAAVTLSGCSFFRGKEAPYRESRESRPLEVPPDLVLPSSSAALQIPPAASAAAAPGEAPPAAFGAAAAFEIGDTLENAFRRVGLALARIDDVKATPVAALNSYEVAFSGESFLVRLAARGESVRVDAISPEGMPVTDGAAAQLLGALQLRLQ